MIGKFSSDKSAKISVDSTTTNKVNKRLQSSLGENDKITPYQAGQLNVNSPLETYREYLDRKQQQRSPDIDHGLLDEEDDEELGDRCTKSGADIDSKRKKWMLLFSIVSAILFAAVVGYALISFVFPPLWLLNITAIVGYVALDAVASIIAAIIGYYTFNKLDIAYNLNWKKTLVMGGMVIIATAALFAVISVASGGLFPLLASIVLGTGLFFTTLSTFVWGLSLWSIIQFGWSKVDGEADSSIQSIIFYPVGADVDFESFEKSKSNFLSDNSITDEGEDKHTLIRKHLPSDSSEKVKSYFILERDDRIEKRAFNNDKYDEFIKLFEDKMHLVEKSGEDQAFMEFLQEKILLLKTPQYEALFRQEMYAFNEINYVTFMDECLNDMSMKGFICHHQQWFAETIALFDKQDFSSQYNKFINAWDKISNQSYSTTSQDYYNDNENNEINHSPN